MNKLWLIIQREYLTRVRKKSFILTTLLAPIALAVFMVVVGLIFSYQGDEVRDVLIIDEANLLDRRIKDERNFYFRFTDRSLDQIKAAADPEVNAVLVIPPLRDLSARRHIVYFYSDKQLDLDAMDALQRALRDKLRDHKIRELQLDAELLEFLNTQVTIDPEPLFKPAASEGGTSQSPYTAIVAAGIGGIMGFAMYMIVFINGMMVMRSVMEEKMNRVVEVMISSVKPFQLMMGKIVGVGAVGLTQVLIWMILIPLVTIGANLIFGFDTQSAVIDSAAAAEGMDPDDLKALTAQVMTEFRAINWWLIVPCFILFFLGGYVIYSSLFAGVGSAIGDDLAESQALTLPLTIPVILALYIMFAALRVPHSSLAVFASIFPLFSPIVMPARLAFDPPAWQVLLSLVLMLGFALFCVWISGRIYRTGILMYGKKASFKEIWKWMTMR